jgi:hypothetical protein
VLNLTAEGYVRRRDFIKVIAGYAVSRPLAVQAQQPDRMRRVSALLGIAENDPETKSRIRAFQLGMRDTGWIEGRNIQIEYRYSGADRAVIDKHVAELIRLAPDVIWQVPRMLWLHSDRRQKLSLLFSSL